MHESTKATPRLLTAAAVTFAVLALAAFAWFAGGATAGAAGTSSGTSGQLRPVQDQPQAQDGAPADRPGGHPCPEESGGSGQGSGTGSGSGSSSTPEAPATGTPSTPL